MINQCNVMKKIIIQYSLLSILSIFLVSCNTGSQESKAVDDIRMGRIPIATDCHWVGYAAIWYN